MPALQNNDQSRAYVFPKLAHRNKFHTKTDADYRGKADGPHVGGASPLRLSKGGAPNKERERASFYRSAPFERVRFVAALPVGCAIRSEESEEQAYQYEAE